MLPCVLLSSLWRYAEESHLEEEATTRIPGTWPKWMKSCVCSMNIMHHTYGVLGSHNIWIKLVLMECHPVSYALYLVTFQCWKFHIKIWVVFLKYIQVWCVCVLSVSGKKSFHEMHFSNWQYKSNWEDRLTVWEISPTTKMYVCFKILKCVT